MKRLVFVVLLFAMGCSFSKLPPLKEYALNPKPVIAKKHTNYKKTVAVSDIDCTPPFDSSFIFFKKGEFEFNRYGNVRWIEPVCLMYKASIERILNATGAFVSGDILRPDYRLSYVIRDFEPVFLPDGAFVVCDIEFRLRDEVSGKIYLHTFKKRIRIKKDSFDDAISSLNRLLNLSLVDLVDWLEKVCPS
ncbi:ABC-type transport auxiliary lipoprotein family protein [Hippea sp. KM1]|uniref:ABC-type transport auxiliary lipoprotein family protein n=1 Tax=Hippea sp. KM1 TaxID=944481 RepID=UPI00046D29FA|nr:ABC-type transport auxiliary lipoprotein family protein [Hippea sp. KM1]